MITKQPFPDGEDFLKGVIERIRNTPVEEFQARLARYEREDAEVEAEYRRLMGISDPEPVASADAPLSLTETQRPRIIRRRPRRAHRVAA